MKLVVIDPRRTETARLAHVHLQPRPNEDATLVAAILHLLLRDGLVDDVFVRDNVDGVAALRRAVAPFTPEYAAGRADVPLGDLLEAAHVIGSARRGGTGGGTGVSMTSRSSLVSYLLLCINSVRGFWAQEGDRVERPNVLLPPNHAKAQAFPPIPAWDLGTKLRVRGLGQTVAGLPTAALAEEILTPGDGQIRALFNVGGSPMMAWPDQRRTRRRWRTSIFGDHRRVVLADRPRRRLRGRHEDDLRDAGHDPGDRRDQVPQHRVRLLRALRAIHADAARTAARLRLDRGLAALLPRRPASRLVDELAERLRLAAGPHGGTARADTARHGVRADHRRAVRDDVPRLEHRARRGEAASARSCVRGAPAPTVAAPDAGCDTRLDVGNATSSPSSRRSAPRISCHAAPDCRPPVPARAPARNRVINSTGRNIPGLIRGRTYNPAFMHSSDLSALDLAPGDAVQIRSAHDAVIGIVEVDDDLRRGVVSMSHGFGGNPGEWKIPASTARTPTACCAPTSTTTRSRACRAWARSGVGVGGRGLSRPPAREHRSATGQLRGVNSAACRM